MGQHQQGMVDEDGYYPGLSPHIERVTTRHKSMARDIVAGGLTQGQIATHYGMSASQVSCIMGSPAFIAELKRLEEGADVAALDVNDHLKRMVPKALDNIEDDLDMDVENHLERQVRQKASLEVLGITGIKPTGHGGIKINIGDHNTQVNVGELSDDELREDVLNLASGE